MYHHVLPEAGFIASSVEQFEAQMRYLAENGWTTLDSATFARYKRGELTLPRKSVLITFDDGWRDNYIYAYPILKRYGLKATLFVVTEWIEKASENPEIFEALPHRACKRTVPIHPGKILLRWEELETMRDHFDIHSHTHSHRDGYFGDSYSWDEEFALSRELLQKRLGIESDQLCWPRGIYDSSLQSRAHQAGFAILYTTRRGVNRSDGESSAIRRLAAKKDARWLKKNLEIFSRTIPGTLYAAVKPE
jgi:peptidoglycan/xylan/chitin deacetylase (PgdA/CDA1 family)